MPSFTVLESDLVALLGVPRSFLREKRGVEKRGEAWEVVHGAIRWDKEAALALGARLTGSRHLITLPLPSSPERLLVASINLPNPILMACAQPGVVLWNRETWCIVRVPAWARNRFVPGMAVLAQKSHDHSWRYLGNPETPDSPIQYPRARGRW